MIDHLIHVKLSHYEQSNRSLAAKSLSILSIFEPQLFIDKYLPILLSKVYSKVMNIREGALLGLSEILIGLSGNSKRNRVQDLKEAMKSISKN